MKKMRFAAAFAVALLFGGLMPIAAEKPATIVMTDGEVDDMNSFLRFLLYANELDIRGIVYTASEWHYRGDGKGTLFESRMPMVRQNHPGPHTDLRWCGTDWIDEFIEKYRAAYPNLVKHDASYPTADALHALVAVGNIDFEGDMAADTDGSNLIKRELLSSDEKEIHFETWGGANTFARALKSIEDEYGSTSDWEEIYERVSKKAVLYNIMDQDETWQNYISVRWPRIRTYFNWRQFASLAYIWPNVVPAPLQQYFRGEWMQEHILKGPIGSFYMTWGDGHKLAGDPEDVFGDPDRARERGYGAYDLISEGDSPSFLYLIDNGLRSAENPSYGGWSGRLSPCVSRGEGAVVWEDNVGSYDKNPYTETLDQYYSQTRFVDAIQNDFAARISWTMNDYAHANHAPSEVRVADGLDITARPGETVTLHASAADPDGDAIRYTWSHYEEAGTYRAAVRVRGRGATARISVPKNAKPGETIHIICEAKDNGAPPLVRYARVILTVE